MLLYESVSKRYQIDRAYVSFENKPLSRVHLFRRKHSVEQGVSVTQSMYVCVCVWGGIIIILCT